jgi:hypothetical protein
MSSISSMRERIQWSKLSRVFQDAIHVCRRLRIRYLWIDSLCIIQDSQSDWEIESARMGEYYSNSIFTISAASSPDGSVPFLMERAQTCVGRTYDLEQPNGQMTTIHSRALEYAGNINQTSTLNMRAWAFQESVLSSRILHYTTSELIWECRTMVSSEHGYLPFDNVSLHFSQLLNKVTDSPLDIYRSIIRAYSARALTRQTDKLPALSGIVSKLQGLIQSRYLAGLWESNLVSDLSWCRDISKWEFQRTWIPTSGEYMAPSWSWASVIGRVGYPGHCDDFHKPGGLIPKGGLYASRYGIELPLCIIIIDLTRHGSHS